MNSVVDHERVWLEPAGAPDRCWCEDNQWGDDGVEYVRADLLERNTTRFPEHMARIVALKDTTLSERIQQLAEAIGLLPKHLHQYQWVADKKQAFGEKSVRSVAGDNGLGMGRQAIAVIPSHLTAVPEFIAAANPDTIAMLLSELLSERSARLTLARLLAEATGALEKIADRPDHSRTMATIARTTLSNIQPKEAGE